MEILSFASQRRRQQQVVVVAALASATGCDGGNSEVLAGKKAKDSLAICLAHSFCHKIAYTGIH